MNYETAAAASAKVTYTSAAGTAVAGGAEITTHPMPDIGIRVFGLTLNELAVIVGIVFTVASFIVTLYYKQKHLELARSRTDAKVIVFDKDE